MREYRHNEVVKAAKAVQQGTAISRVNDYSYIRAIAAAEVRVAYVKVAAPGALTPRSVELLLSTGGWLPSSYELCLNPGTYARGVPAGLHKFRMDGFRPGSRENRGQVEQCEAGKHLKIKGEACAMCSQEAKKSKEAARRAKLAAEYACDVLIIRRRRPDAQAI
jgi:hypothetical protein